MQHVVLDMEWNQPWPGSPSAQKVLPSPIRGEIIQIGAVRLDAEGSPADEFRVLIRPCYYRHMNRKVSSLTGIRDSTLAREGVPFPEAIRRFRDWCGEPAVFLTWGFDDIRILQENLVLFGLETDWCGSWYNAQMIYNFQTDGSTAQKALKTAMAECGIQPSRPAHDALGDAYHTAVICSRLNLDTGIAQYAQAMKSHENGFHGAEVPGCLMRHVYHGYIDRTNAVAAMSGEKNLCPVCEKPMALCTRWYSQQGHRYSAQAKCEEHGSFMVRIRLTPEEQDRVRVGRMVYAPDSEPAQSFQKMAGQRKKSGRGGTGRKHREKRQG